MTDKVELEVDAVGKGWLIVNGRKLRSARVTINAIAGHPTSVTVVLPASEVLAKVDTEYLKILGYERKRQRHEK